MRAYANAAQTDSDTLVANDIDSLANAQDLRLNGDLGSTLFDGLVDEVRIRAGAVTSDEIALDYANLVDDEFIEVGDEELP